MTESDWFGLYGGSLKAWLVPEAFQHPAKFSRRLIDRIYAHAIEEGWLVPGVSRVLDPMAGVGVGGIAAANAGLDFHGIELEKHFHDLALQNFEKHAQVWIRLGKPLPTIQQGDSRFLLQLVGGVDAVVSSPPYANQAVSPQGGGPDQQFNEDYKAGRRGHLPRERERSGYSVVISSPPFASPGEQPLASQSQLLKAGYAAFKSPEKYFHGVTPGQLGALPTGNFQAVVSSPPYVGGGHHPDQTGSWGGLQEEKAVGLGTKAAAGYGDTAGQIGRMPEGALSRGHNPSLPTSYWESCASIYAQCFALLPPGGHIILVVKGHVRNKTYVDLPAQTAQLLETVGFRLLHWHRAWLISQVAQYRLDGGEDRKETKSFFRRLQERKGLPKIDFEVVLCTERS